MTTPKTGALDARLQRLHERKKQLDAQISAAAGQQRTRERTARTKRLIALGSLVELAALDGLDTAIVLGMLLEARDKVGDATQREVWRDKGEAVLQERHPDTRPQHAQ